MVIMVVCSVMWEYNFHHIHDTLHSIIRVKGPWIGQLRTNQMTKRPKKTTHTVAHFSEKRGTRPPSTSPKSKQRAASIDVIPSQRPIPTRAQVRPLYFQISLDCDVRQLGVPTGSDLAATANHGRLVNKLRIDYPTLGVSPRQRRMERVPNGQHHAGRVNQLIQASTTCMRQRTNSKMPLVDRTEREKKGNVPRVRYPNLTQAHILRTVANAFRQPPDTNYAFHAQSTVAYA